MSCDVNARYGVSANIYVVLHVSGLDCVGGWLRGCVAHGREAIAPLGHVADVIKGLIALHGASNNNPNIKILLAVDRVIDRFRLSAISANFGCFGTLSACQNAEILFVLAEIPKFWLKLKDGLYRFWCFGKKTVSVDR